MIEPVQTQDHKPAKRTSSPGWLPLAILGLTCLLLGLYPENHAAVEAVVQGQALAQEKHYSAALSAWESASRLTPGNPLPYLYQGQVLTEQGRHLEAWTAYLNAIRLGGSNDRLQAGLARLYLAQHSPDLAIGVLRPLLARRPAQADLWSLLAEAYHAQGERPDELKAWLSALETGLSDAQRQHAQSRVALLCLEVEAPCALAYMAQARYGPDRSLAQAAETMFDALERIATGQDTAAVRTRLGQALLDLGQTALARQEFARAVERDPTYALGYAYLGYAESLLGEADAAQTHLEHAVEQLPQDPQPRLLLGLHYSHRGWWITARDVLFEAHRLDPTNPAICAAMAETYLQGSPPDHAAAGYWLHAAVGNAPQEADFHLLLAHFYVDYGVEPFPRGVTVARVAVNLAPDNAEAHETLGWAYFLSNRFDWAVSSLKQAYALAETPGQQARIAYRLGEAYRAMQEMQKACPFYQQALDLDWNGVIGSRARQQLTLCHDLNFHQVMVK